MKIAKSTTSITTEILKAMTCTRGLKELTGATFEVSQLMIAHPDSDDERTTCYLKVGEEYYRTVSERIIKKADILICNIPIDSDLKVTMRLDKSSESKYAVLNLTVIDIDFESAATTATNREEVE